jgi:hypothetical protein
MLTEMKIAELVSAHFSPTEALDLYNYLNKVSTIDGVYS